MSLSEQINRGLNAVPDYNSDFIRDQWDETVREIQMSARMVATFDKNSEKVENQIYHWTEQGKLYNGGDITDVYTNGALSSAYVSGGVAGTQLFVKMALADAQKIRENDLLMLADSVTDTFVRSRVTAVVLDGASSYAVIKLKQADTDSILASASLTFVLSNAHAEKSGPADPMAREPTKRTNYAQFLSDSTANTRFMLRTAERISPKKQARDLKNMIMRHREAKQISFILGAYDSEDLADGLMLTTDGFISSVETYEPDNIFNFTTDTGYSGATFRESGFDFCRRLAEQVSRTGESGAKDVYLSSWAQMLLLESIEYRSHMSIDPTTDKYGNTIRTLEMPGQSWNLINDGTMNKYPLLRNKLLVVEPGCVGQRVFDPFRTHKVPIIHVNDAEQHETAEVAGFWYSNLEAQAVVTISELNTI